jgi:hypothetical protein
MTNDVELIRTTLDKLGSLCLKAMDREDYGTSEALYTAIMILRDRLFQLEDQYVDL